MNLQGKLMPKVQGLLMTTIVLYGIASLTIFIYARYISPTAQESLGTGILIILLISLPSILVALSLIVFSDRVKTAHPLIAYLVPLTVFIATNGYLIFTLFADGYKFTFKLILVYLIFCLVVFTLLNVIIYFSTRNKHL